MMRGMPRMLFSLIAVILVTIFYIYSYVTSTGSETVSWEGVSEDSVIMGSSVMPDMGDQEKREELGRSSWHLLHVMAQRYPKEPAPDEQQAMLQFIHLIGRLYPCGDCARHFKAMLDESPPQVESRDALKMWFCERHNEVNVRLGKEEFDCTKLEERWKCGCEEEALEEAEEKEKAA